MRWRGGAARDARGHERVKFDVSLATRACLCEDAHGTVHVALKDRARLAKKAYDTPHRA